MRNHGVGSLIMTQAGRGGSVPRCVVAGLAILCLATTGCAQSVAAESRASSMSSPAVDLPISGATSDGFTVFARKADAKDSLPKSLAVDAASVEPEDEGPSFSRRVGTIGDVTFYLTRTTHNICIQFGHQTDTGFEGSTACDSLSRVKAHGLGVMNKDMRFAAVVASENCIFNTSHKSITKWANVNVLTAVDVLDGDITCPGLSKTNVHLDSSRAQSTR
jgi:hypothetical protein